MLAFWITAYRLNKRTLRYQLERLGYQCLSSSYAFMAVSMHSLCSHYGRFWFFFACAIISINDASAFFAGKAFGRHKLIKLSPNKTWEGFIGAFFLTSAVCAFWAKSMLTSDDAKLYVCGNKAYSWSLFENWDCEVHPVFTYRDFVLPFPVFGISEINCMPA